MLATPLILFKSPFSRVLGMFVPAFNEWPAGLPQAVPVDPVVDGAGAGVHCRRVAGRSESAAVLVAGGFIVVQMVTMGMMGDIAAMKSIDLAIGRMPAVIVVLTGFTIGTATSWLGWQAGRATVWNDAGQGCGSARLRRWPPSRSKSVTSDGIAVGDRLAGRFDSLRMPSKPDQTSAHLSS